MRYRSIVLISLFLIDPGLAQNVTTSDVQNEEVLINDADNHTWTSKNFPHPYPKENHTLVLKVLHGYSIVIFVEELDLDSSKGDFLLIKGGQTLKDENKGVVLTYEFKTKRRYLIDNTSAYLAFRVLGENIAKKKGFRLIYQRIGIEIKTTEAPLSTIPWPTPSYGDRMYLTVNVTGKAQEDFANATNLNSFKNTVANMANEYCTIQNIALSQAITIQNIHISTLTRCSYNWPESEMCVQIKLSIPVFLAENSTLTGYQLSAQHLDHMWELLADKWLPTVALLVYKEPNSNSKLILWLAISATVLVVLAVIMLIIKNCSHRNLLYATHIKRRRSDTNGIVENEVKPRKMSMAPHPLQVIPPFFDNDSFFQYEPKIDIPSKEGDFFTDESDDEIVVSHFSNNQNFIPTHHNKNFESNT